MNFKEAMNIITGCIDDYYEEHCSSGFETEEYKEIASAERVFENLVAILENNNIKSVNELERWI